MPDTLRFGRGNAVFDLEMIPQVTVRRGTKWLDAAGEVVIANEEGLPLLGTVRAHIVKTEKMRFCDIPVKWVRMNHNPMWRTKESLFFAMRNAYKDFEETEEVTVVFFALVP